MNDIELLKGTTVVASTLTLGKGILNIVALSKLKLLAGVTAALMVVGGTTTVVLHHLVQPASQTTATAESADDALALEILNRSNSRALDAAPPLVFCVSIPNPEDSVAHISRL